jgi:hypothetical protein
MAEPSDELQNLFRLIAIECLLSEMLTIRYLAAPDPVAAASAHRQYMRKIWSETAASFLGNAADSELMVGGIGDAIDELIERAGQSAARKVGEPRQP